MWCFFFFLLLLLYRYRGRSPGEIWKQELTGGVYRSSWDFDCLAGLIRSIEEPMHHVAHDLKVTHNFLFICVSPFSIGEMILSTILAHLHPKIKSTAAKYGRNLHQERLHCWSCNLPVRSKPSTSVWHRDWVMSLRGKAVSLIWLYRWNHPPPTMQTRGSSYQLKWVSDFTDLCF